MTSVLSPAFDSLLQDTSTKFAEGEAADVIRELKEHYPDRCELFDQDDLYGALKQLHRLGAIDDDGDTKLLEVLAEKTSKKDQVLELINGYRESVPPCKNGFVGRDDDVNKIIKLVANSRVPGINLFGESGVGKTTLAKEVSKQLKDFDTLYIDLRDIKDVNTVYFLVLEKFNLPAWDYSKERIYKHLKDLTRTTVLILDNIEQLLSKDDTADEEMGAKFLEFLLAIISTETSKRGRLKVVLTSKLEIKESSLKAKFFTEYKVKPFSKEVSKVFISKRVSKDLEVSSEEYDKALTEISELCRDTPYLLQGAEQLIRKNYCTSVQVLGKITTQIEKGVPKEFACISALFDSIPNDHLKEVAVKISLLRRPFSLSTAIKIAELSSDHHPRFDLEMLVNHKIITAEDVDGKRKYDLHALFREFVTSYLCKEHSLYKKHFKRGESQFFEHFSGKLTKLAFLLETEFVKTYSKLEVNKANFELTIEISLEQKETFDQLLHCDEFRIFAKMGILFEVLKDSNERRELFGKWAEAAEKQEKWLTSALMRCWQSIQGSDLKGTLNEEILGKASASIQKANEAIKKPKSTTSSENVKEEEKKLKVESLFLHCRGKIKWMRAKIMTLEQRKNKDGKKLLEEGINDLQKAVSIGKELMGDNTLTARAYNLIGNCYMELDSYQEAEKYYQKALYMKIVLVKREKHWEIPTYYNQMAQVHEMLAREEEEKWYNRFIGLKKSAIKEHKEAAVVWMKKALKLQKELGVSDTDHTAIFQRNLANIFIGLGQYGEALEYAEKSYKIRNTRLGRHPETVRILYLIGIIHEWRKDHEAALQSYEKAFEMEESLPADNHSVVRKLLCDRLKEMRKKTKNEEKLKEYGSRIKVIQETTDLTPKKKEIKLEEVKLEEIKLEEIKLDRAGGSYDLSEKGFFLYLPPNAIAENTNFMYRILPEDHLPSPSGAAAEGVVSYIIQMKPLSVPLNSPITVTLMHSGTGEKFGYETVVKAFSHEQHVWEDMKGQQNKSHIQEDCECDYIQVQIHKLCKLTTLAAVSRLITDKFEVTPDGCVVKSSVCSDVTLEFPEGAVDKTVKGRMQVLLMPKHMESVSYASPILLLHGFEGVHFLQYVAIRMPLPSLSKLSTTPISIFCLEEGADSYEFEQWKDIKDQVYYVENKNSIEFHVLHFSAYCCLKFIKCAGSSLKRLLKIRKKVVFAAFKEDKKPSTLLKLTLSCFPRHKIQKELRYMAEVLRCKTLDIANNETQMREGDKAYIRTSENIYSKEINESIKSYYIKLLTNTDLKMVTVQEIRDENPLVVISFFASESETDNNPIDKINIVKEDLFQPYSPDDVYEIKSSPKGLSVIINMEEFDAKTKLTCRKGSRNDVEMLDELFKYLDFETEIHENKNKNDLLSELKRISESPDLKSHDCFALCIMSHGEEDSFFTSDGEKIRVADIRDMFKNSACSSLKGKPKLFFIQACRGKLIDRGVVSDDPHRTEEHAELTSSELQANNNKLRIPDYADILIAYGCYEGHESYRHKEDGSFFIQKLTKVFREYAQQENVLSMLTRVNNEVSNLSGGNGKKQIPEPRSTLRRKVFLRPKS